MGWNVGTMYNDYARDVIRNGAPPPPKTYFHGWTPKLTIDEAFLNSKQNTAKDMHVQVQGDRIILPRDLGRR